MHFGRIGSGVPIVIGVASLSLLISACGGTSGGVADSRPSGSTTSGSTSTSKTESQRSAAVLQAYSAGWSAFEHALTTANAYDSTLPATMVNPQLQHVRANLLGDSNSGVVGRGTFTLHPKVVSLTSTTATVIDCAYSTSVLVYSQTGKPVPPVTPPENDGIRATLILSGGKWNISQQSVTDGTCATGS